MKATRAHIAFSLLVLWASACLAPWLPWLSWKLNQTAIAERFCENRSRPELNCNGKCYLAKYLRATDEQPVQQAPATQSLEFGWIGGLLPLGHIECPPPRFVAPPCSLIPRDWPLPSEPVLGRETPPPWV